MARAKYRAASESWPSGDADREEEKAGERCPGKRPLPRRTAPGAIRGDRFMISHPPGPGRWMQKGDRDGSLTALPPDVGGAGGAAGLRAAEAARARARRRREHEGAEARS